MKRLLILFNTIALLLPTLGYGQSRFTNPEFASLANKENTLAILPFQVTTKLRPKDTAKMTNADLKKKEIESGYTAQSAMENFLLKRNKHQKYSVTFQDVGKTNGLLKEKDISADSLSEMDPKQICKLLGVDGFISGNLVSSHPLSTGAAIALDYFVGFGGKTNAGDCTISVHDGSTGNLMWKYHRRLSQGLGSNINTIIYKMMKKASHKFPYNK